MRIVRLEVVMWYGWTHMNFSTIVRKGGTLFQMKARFANACIVNKVVSLAQ